MRRRNIRWGCAAVGLGIIILLALVLPEKIWWLLLAVALIYMGLRYMRCC